MREKHLLGVLDSNTGLMQVMAYTFQYNKETCEEEGYLWVFGHCFELLKDEVTDILMISEQLKGGKQVISVYAITENEKSG